jgi:AcrR family transcriptional regulator
VTGAGAADAAHSIRKVPAAKKRKPTRARAKRGPGRPAGRTSQETKRILLEAAHREFADLGYAAATTPSIVERAGVSPSVLYHHFGSKPALYSAVIEWQLDISLEAFEKAIDGKKRLLERIDAILQAQTVIWPQYGHDNPILVMAPFEVRRHPELKDARRQLRRNESFYRKLVAESEDVPKADDGLVQMCIAVVWGLSGVGAIVPDVSIYLDTVESVRRLVAGDVLGTKEKRKR